MVEWSYNPWRHARGWRHPVVALLLELSVAALAGYAFTAPPGGGAPDTGELLRWGGFALVFLLAGTASLFLPVRYRLDERGVTVWFLGVPSSRPWQHYRNYYLHATGVHLTTMPRPSALDPFRGHFLLFAGNREQVAPVLASHLGRTPAGADTS